MARRILLVGGGTGGHVYPLIAVAESLRDRAEIRILGDRAVVAPARAANLPYRTILAGKFRRYFSPLILLDLCKLPLGFVQSLWQLFWYMPDVVFAKGGYVSLAPVIAARLYAIPVYLHESDSVPGLANRVLAKLSRVVFTSFPEANATFGKKAVLVGNPVRPELFGADRAAALGSFQLSPDHKVILVQGGSQGAKQLNDVVLAGLVELTEHYQVIHQCGQSQYAAVKAEVDRVTKEGSGSYGTAVAERYRLYPFLDTATLAAAYAAADLVVSRAGAGSMFELAQLGKPAILVPLANSAGGHQLKNAQELAKFGAVVIEGTNITPHVLLNQIEELLKPDVAVQVGQRIRQFAKPDAAATIAAALLSA